MDIRYINSKCLQIWFINIISVSAAAVGIAIGHRLNAYGCKGPSPSLFNKLWLLQYTVLTNAKKLVWQSSRLAPFVTKLGCVMVSPWSTKSFGLKSSFVKWFLPPWVLKTFTSQIKYLRTWRQLWRIGNNKALSDSDCDWITDITCRRSLRFMSASEIFGKSW